MSAAVNDFKLDVRAFGLVHFIYTSGTVDVYDFILCAMNKQNIAMEALDRTVGVHVNNIRHIAAAQLYILRTFVLIQDTTRTFPT